METLFGLLLAIVGVLLLILGVKMFVKSNDWFYLVKSLLVFSVGFVASVLSFGLLGF